MSRSCPADRWWGGGSPETQPFAGGRGRRGPPACWWVPDRAQPL